MFLRNAKTSMLRLVSKNFINSFESFDNALQGVFFYRPRQFRLFFFCYEGNRLIFVTVPGEFLFFLKSLYPGSFLQVSRVFYTNKRTIDHRRTRVSPILQTSPSLGRFHFVFLRATWMSLGCFMSYTINLCSDSSHLLNPFNGRH